mmetsp:Transcript_4203/g.14218  ORF Transcript_4203/g.14218 Transcript_4203/m.14218 type:complete len:211 (+) Transcript_4203:679-1311(+)
MLRGHLHGPAARLCDGKKCRPRLNAPNVVEGGSTWRGLKVPQDLAGHVLLEIARRCTIVSGGTVQKFADLPQGIGPLPCGRRGRQGSLLLDRGIEPVLGNVHRGLPVPASRHRLPPGRQPAEDQPAQRRGNSEDLRPALGAEVLRAKPEAINEPLLLSLHGEADGPSCGLSPQQLPIHLLAARMRLHKESRELRDETVLRICAKRRLQVL